MNTFNLRLDLDKSTVVQVVTLRQGDTDGTTISATVYDHGALADLSGISSAYIEFALPDGEHYYRSTATVSGSVVTALVDEEQAASVPGRACNAYFSLSDGTHEYSTASFVVAILRDATDGLTPGETYDSAIQAAIDGLNGAVAELPDTVEGIIEDHPEWTTTVQDGSITDAKLIQHGGILDRVARLQYRLDNLLTATPAEADSLNVTDAALTPLVGLSLYGRSTQAGTPTPSNPVPISSVTGNLYRETVYSIGATWTVNTITVTKKAYSSYVINGTSTGLHWLYGGGGSLDDRLFVTLPAGTYTATLGGNGASNCQIAVRGKVNGSSTTIATGASPQTFTLTEDTPVKAAIFTNSGKTFINSEVSIQLYEGSSAGGAFVPFGSVGLWSRRTSDATKQSVIHIDPQGHALRSLPDGTRDVVTVDKYGNAVLTQRVQLTTQAVTDGVTGTVGVDVMSSTGEIADGATVLYKLTTPATIDLGTIDPVALQGPDMTAQAVPTAPFALTYERDLNVTLARLEASIADAATS